MGIIAWEGPAGSGKSWRIRQMQAGEDVTILERPKLPRNLGPALGAWSSSWLEYQAVSAAVMWPKRTFVVDRFLLSRWVYRAIEEGELDEFKTRRRLQGCWDALVTMAQGEAWRRMGVWVNEPPQVLLNVLLPDLEELCERRRSGLADGKTYPFSPATELTLYAQVARLADGLPGVTVRIVRS